MNHPILKRGELGSPFGFRDNPLTRTVDSKHHNGLDLKAPVGTTVYAPFDAQVYRIDRNGVGRGKHNGNAVFVSFDTPEPPYPGEIVGTLDVVYDNPRDHAWLRFRAAFLHLDAFDQGLKVWDVVPAGCPLGTVGATGDVTGPHLHFQVWTTIITTDAKASRRVPWTPVDPASLGWTLIGGR